MAAPPPPPTCETTAGLALVAGCKRRQHTAVVAGLRQAARQLVAGDVQLFHRRSERTQRYATSEAVGSEIHNLWPVEEEV